MSKQIQPPSRPPQSQSASAQRPQAGSSANLLDFSSPSPQSTLSPTAPRNDLASSIQPQRRGRPAREAAPNQMPPMPQPPTISSPAPQPVPASTSTPGAQKNRMQVTGEREQARPIPSAQSSVDAFGLPSSAPKQQGSASSGFTDSFTAKPFRPTSRFGRGLSSNNSGFGDSFDTPSAGGSAKSPILPRANVQAPTPSGIEKISPAQLEITQTTSPTATGSKSTMGDDNFESRYPSIDVLSADDTTSPVPNQRNLISPIASPPNVSRPSMLGSMTGGDMGQSFQHLGIGGEPQPRSTHVTGTAFKSQSSQSQASQHQPQRRGDGFTRSPSPIKSKREHFETMSSAKAQGGPRPAPKEPVDLMTGEENESMGAPLLQRQGSSMAPGPAPDKRGAMEGTEMEVDSSDDEAGPESAGIDHRSYSPDKDDSLSESPVQSTRISDRLSAFQKSPEVTKSASLPPIDDLPSNANRDAGPMSRPKSMYALPPTLPDGSSPTKTDSGLPVPPNGRPSHVRKGSINDMVSKFEGLNPSQTTSASASASDSPSVAGLASGSKSKPKPTVVTKPATLKKPTLDTVRTDPSTGRLQSPILPNGHGNGKEKSPQPVKPGKPASLAKSNPSDAAPQSSSTGNGSTSQQGLGVGGGSKFGETVRPDGYSRSSSGRSFPIVKPKPAITTSSTSASTSTTQSPNTNARGQSPTRSNPSGHSQTPQSPEKQQSVNSLVARWNQGEMARKPPVVKPKPVL